jgi:hypothetical protein
MTEATHIPGTSSDEVQVRAPAVQRLLDHPFLLLLAGLAVPSVLVLAWRVVQVLISHGEFVLRAGVGL